MFWNWNVSFSFLFSLHAHAHTPRREALIQSYPSHPSVDQRKGITVAVHVHSFRHCKIPSNLWSGKTCGCTLTLFTSPLWRSEVHVLQEEEKEDLLSTSPTSEWVIFTQCYTAPSAEIHLLLSSLSLPLPPSPSLFLPLPPSPSLFLPLSPLPKVY